MGKWFPFSSREKPFGVGVKTEQRHSLKRGVIKLSYNICVTFAHALTSREETDIKTNGEHPDSPNAGRVLQPSKLHSWDRKTRDRQRSLFSPILLLLLFLAR